tara:strand:+ start:476 stop:1045 length:570 start_codon:yes stop_codon:yes gene_type:complete
MIVYIHGFNSNGVGSKYTELVGMFPDIEIFSPSYDSSDFSSIDSMIDEIGNKISDSDNTLFIGCSLGGYLAQYLAKHFNSKSILLNPCYDPQGFLSTQLGENILYSERRGYDLTMENVRILEKYEVSPTQRGETNIIVFTNKDDDTIPYEGVVNYYRDRPVGIFETGSHRFTNLEDIKNDIIESYNSAF